MIHYRCLTSYIPKTALERVSDTTEILPAQKSFPSLSPADAVTSAAAELTEALQNPTTSSPIPHLGEKQTMSLKQLEAIFNTAVPKAPAQPPAKLPRVETPKPPHPRTQQPATTVPMEPATRQRVNIKDHVTITPGRKTRKPTQTIPHVIPDETEAFAPLTHPYNGKPDKIPPVHIYNTRARRMQGHDLMANQIATVQPLNPPNKAVHT